MFFLAKDVQFNVEQRTQATLAMLQVALVDDVCTVEEQMLIRAFYEDGTEVTPFASLLALAKTAPALTADSFPVDGQRDTVVASCILVGYADGTMTAAERKAVRTIAMQIGVPGDRLDQLYQHVQEFMLQDLIRTTDAATLTKLYVEMQSPDGQ